VGDIDLVPAGSWKLFDIATGKNAPPANAGTTPPANGSGSATPPTNFVVYAQVAPIMQKNCAGAGCHSSSSRVGGAALDTFQDLKTNLARALASIDAGRMPRGRSMPDADKKMLRDWQTQGALEKLPTTTPAAGGATPPNGTASGGGDANAAGQPVTEFRIKQGTGNGDWNTAATIVTVKVGTQFTIHNDDSVVHQWHTNGAPCSHGNAIQPGGSASCNVTAPYDNNPVLYDHGTNGKFHIRAVR